MPVRKLQYAWTEEEKPIYSMKKHKIIALKYLKK